MAAALRLMRLRKSLRFMMMFLLCIYLSAG